MTRFSVNCEMSSNNDFELTYACSPPSKYEFLGKVKIPLLRIQNNVRRWYALKEKKLRAPAKGDNPQIMLEMFFVYNKVCLFMI